MSVHGVLLHPGNPGGGNSRVRPPRLPELKGTIGRYKRHELIGAGAMGEVHRGTNERNESVIIKFISLAKLVNHLKVILNSGRKKAEEAKTDLIAFILRFLNEYDLGSMIRHPNLARVIDTNIRLAIPKIDALKNIFRKKPTGEYITPLHMRRAVLLDFDLDVVAQKDIFIVTEFVPDKPGSTTPAPTVANCFKGGTLSLAVVKKCFLPVFDLLAQAHQAEVAHRDLKPDNMLVTSIDGQAVIKVIDFGIARETDQDRKTQLTRIDRMLGTPTYMPPSAYTGAAPDNPEVFKISDIYSMGMIIYELMGGKNPFKGLNMSQMFAAKAKLTYFDFSRIDPKAQPVIRKMLSPKWQDNYSSMQEVIEAWRSL